MAKRKNKKAEFVLWMGPILDALRELGDSGSPKEVSDLIAKNLNVPDAKREELTESGVPRFHNQVCWARQYLVWEGFENLCKYILRVFGFENVVVTPRGKDDGIDGYGVLQINPFVSFKVIFQCKRYQGTVSRAQVGDLRNAMLGRADKGIVMTTGIFSEEAKREASRDGAPPIELIDGEALLNMLEQEEIGLKTKTIFEIDYSFFEPYMPKGKVEQSDEG